MNTSLLYFHTQSSFLRGCLILCSSTAIQKETVTASGRHRPGQTIVRGIRPSWRDRSLASPQAPPGAQDENWSEHSLKSNILYPVILIYIIDISITYKISSIYPGYVDITWHVDDRGRNTWAMIRITVNLTVNLNTKPVAFTPCNPWIPFIV